MYYIYSKVVEIKIVVVVVVVVDEMLIDFIREIC